MESPDEHDEKHVDLRDTSKPLTTNLNVLINSCYIVEAELRYQVDRLTRVEPRTESEREHTEQLREGYKSAYHSLKTLRRYHEGRKYRQQKTGTSAPIAADESGIAPVFGADHDDPHGARNG